MPLLKEDELIGAVFHLPPGGSPLLSYKHHFAEKAVQLRALDFRILELNRPGLIGGSNS